MSSWVNLCKVDELKNGEMLTFDSEKGKRILLANIGHKFYAVDGICTRQYSELSEGFLNAEEKTVTCPLHLSVFSLIDGKPRNPLLFNYYIWRSLNYLLFSYPSCRTELIYLRII